MKFEQVLQTHSTTQEVTRNTAQLISQVGSPPLTTLMGAAFLLSVDAESWMAFSVFAVFSVLLPLGYVAYLLRKGVIGDMHMKHREERLLPLIAACVSNVLGLSVLYDLGGENALFQFAFVQCIIAFLFLGITPFYKISLHSASAGVLFFVSVQLTGYVIAPLMSFVVIGWSRVYLKRHTKLQVLLGGGLGCLVWGMIGSQLG